MATRTPTRPEDEEIHGEQQPKPVFGPGYDKQETLHKPAGSSPESQKEKASSPESLQNAEENPSQPAPSGVSDREKQLSGSKAGGSEGHIGYRSGDKFSPISSRLGNLKQKIIRNKKKVATGGIIGAVTGVSFFGFGIISGPAQLIQLSQILRTSLSGMERDKQVRAPAMIRYWKTGDIGETRLSIVGTRVAGRAITKLEKNGITFHDKDAAGRPRYTEIRTDKNAATQGQDLTFQEQQRAIARAMNVPIDDVKLQQRLTPEHRVFRIYDTPDNRGLNNLNNIQRNGLKQVSSGKWLFGKYVTSNEHRTLKRKFGLPRLFSPVEKLTGNLKTRFVRWASNKEEKIKERRNLRKGRAANYKGPIATKIDKAKEKVRNRPNLIGRAGWGLTFTAGVCVARGVASSVAIANRAAIVSPSVIEATHYTALGDQEKSGQNARLEQYGLEADFLQDKDGNTVWSAQPLNALSDPQAKGKDLDLDYKQSFSNQDVESSIKDKFDIKVGPVSVAKPLCSKLGLAVQGIAGLGLTWASCETFVGCSYAIGKFATSSIASAIAISFLSDRLVDALEKGEIDFESLPAEQKGALLAYGAREGANMNARASGGTMLSDSDQQAMEQEQRLASQKEFQSKSWATRMFDTHDYRSLISRTIIQKTSPSPKQNIKNVASTLLNFGNSIISSFSGFLSALIPSVFAEESYNWNFPKYGIPRSVFNDPNYADPYKNAKKVASIFGDNEDHKYIKRAKKCFAVDIKKDSSGRWDAVSNDEIVNPAITDYHKANCDDDNSDWRRVQMFVFDSRLADSMACLDEDEEFGAESCANLAADDSGAAAPGGESSVAATGSPRIEKFSPPLASPGGKINPKGVTLHWWGSNSGGRGIAALVDALRGNTSCGAGGCSVQFAITNDGKIYQMTANENDLTYHAKGGNETTFGIEMEGGSADFGRNGMNRYPQKFQSAVYLVKYLVDKYNLPINGPTTCNNVRGIHPHKAYNHCGETKDDIDDFYFNAILRAVQL